MSMNVIPETGLSIVVPHAKPTLDIVFVHGFTGHPERTWTYEPSESEQSEEDDGEISHPPLSAGGLLISIAHQNQDRGRSGIFWPRDLLPAAVPNARVLTYGYGTHIRRQIGQRIREDVDQQIARDFLVALEADRKEEPRRPLLFIVHSLGVIVVKELLRQSWAFDQGQTHLRDVFESTTGVMFFGSPHGGAKWWWEIADPAYRLLEAMGYKDAGKIVSPLLPSCPRLRELGEFTRMALEKQWTIHSFQEQLGMRALGGRKVVEDASSCLHCSEIEITEHIRKNHMDLCRFSGPEDIEYKKVDAALRRMTAKFTTNRIPNATSSLAKQRRQQLRDSLGFDQIEARYKSIRRAYARTCKWLATKDEYLTWLDPSKIAEHHGFLWIKGKPGTGKSTLMKFALDEAQRTMRDRVILSFFFKARGGRLEHSTVGMYRSLLSQLLHSIPGLDAIFDLLHLPPATWPQGGGIKWRVKELKDLFELAVRNLGQSWVVCFIDALDECNEDEIRDMVSFFEYIGEMALASNIRLQICFSSRHYRTITMAHGLELILEVQEGHKRDIAYYVDSEIKIGQSILAAEISAELQEKASGVFLWIVLVVGILNREYDPGRLHALHDRLREIPASLHDLFRHILTRDSRGREEFILCTQWILFAKEPLKPEELYFAVLTGSADEPVAPWDQELITPMVIHRFIVDASRGLAEITKSKSPRVQFVDESVRDFLLKDNGLQDLWPDSGKLLQRRSHEHLKERCVKYICSHQLLTALRNYHCDRAQESFPFLKYAVSGALYHANEAESNGISQRGFLQSFPLMVWIYMHNLVTRQRARQHTSKANLLHQAAEDGYLAVGRLLLEANANKDAKNKFRRTPLHNAVLNGHLAFARLLLDAGADVDVADKDGCTPLSRAVRAGNLEMTRLLLNAGANTEAVDKDGWRVLLWATRTRNFEMTKLLLEAGADKEAVDKDGWTPLVWAARAGNSVIAKLLLETGADKETAGSDRWTPLLWAAKAGDSAMTKLLLEAGANKEAADTLKRMPLSWAAGSGSTEATKLLLEWGANKEAADENWRTPLSWAVQAGTPETTKLLLDAGADKEVADINGRTPLSWAAKAGTPETTKLLLDAGADKEAADINGRTPLSWPAESWRLETTMLLLEAGANKESVDRNGWTPLTWAARAGNSEMTKLLLEVGADTEAADSDGRTLFSWAVEAGNSEMMRLLLQAGADKEAVDKDLRTPLSWAAGAGRSKTMKLLLQTRANKEAVDKNGRTPLSWAAASGSFETAKLLLEAGAKKDAADKSGQTPLHWAAKAGKFETTKLLLVVRADKQAADKNGWTPLLWAAWVPNSEMTRLLLEAGADKEAADKDLRTPLSWAAGRGCSKTVKLLLKAGADKEAADKDLRTPLSWAARCECSETMKLLLEAGADKEAADKDGRTPLSWAAATGNLATAKLLLEAGADTEAVDKDGRTPVTWAAMTGNSEMTRLLFETGTKTTKLLLYAGADKEAVDEDWRAPLPWATNAGISETTELLLEAGADKAAVDKNGWVRPSWAPVGGRSETMKLLLQTGAEKGVPGKYGRTPLSWAEGG